MTNICTAKLQRITRVQVNNLEKVPFVQYFIQKLERLISKTVVDFEFVSSCF